MTISQRFCATFISALTAFVFLASPVHASLLDKIQWKTEKHFGNATVQQMGQYYGFIESPALTDYINRMGRSIAGVGDRTDINYEFFIVDTDEVNAFAAPGGFVFVTRGLLEEAETEDEIAGVVGHEVAHISAMHGAKRIKKLPFIFIGMSILSSRTDEKTTRAAGYAFSLMQLHYSREDEYEADMLGARYSRNAGYDARSLASMFHKLERERPSGNLTRLEVALSSHPKTTGRINRLFSYPELAEALEETLYRATGYAARHYYHEAAREHRSALSLDPSNARAMNGLAQVLVELGELDEAADWFRAALVVDPENSIAGHGLEHIENLKKADSDGLDMKSFAAMSEDARRASSSSLETAAESIDLVYNSTSGGFAALTARLDRMKEYFYRDLPAFITTADKIKSNDRGRNAILNQAFSFFGGYLAALDYYEDTGHRLLSVAQDMKVSARKAAYVLSKSERADTVAERAAADLERALLRMSADSDFLFNRVIETADNAERGYETTRAAMRELDFSVFTTEGPIDSFTGSILFNRTLNEIESLEKSFSSTEKISESLDRNIAGFRRASVNLNAALMSGRERETLMKLMERRFGMNADATRALLEKGFGAADAALIQSMAAAERKEPLEFAYGFTPGEGLSDENFYAGRSGGASGDALLLKLIENDIKAVSGRLPLVEMTPEPEPEASEFIAFEPGDEALESAARLIAERRADEAIEIINARGKSNPATMAAHSLLAIAHMIRDDSASAVNELKHALKKRNDVYALRLAMGNAFTDLERYDDALNEYAAAKELAPLRREAFSASGYVFAMKGVFSDAEQNFIKAMSMGDERPETVINLGLLYYREGRLADALAMFEKALEIDPSRELVAGMAAALK